MLIGPQKFWGASFIWQVLRKFNEIGMKSDYESDDNLQITVSNLPALVMVSPTEVAVTSSRLAAYRCQNKISNIHLKSEAIKYCLDEIFT